MNGPQKSSDGGGETVPATPFLFIPQAVRDIGVTRPFPGSFGWVDGPAILLVHEVSRTLTCTPEPGNAYRVLVVLGNAGLAPAQNTFAEFYAIPLPPLSMMPHQPIEILSAPVDIAAAQNAGSVQSLGVAAVPAVAGQQLGWAMSPRSFDGSSIVGPWYNDGSMFALVRVFEPLNDVSAFADFRAISDRKAGARFFTPDLSGVWTGGEYDMAGGGKLLGTVTLDISQTWSVASTAHGCKAPLSDVRIASYPSLAPKFLGPHTVRKAGTVGGYIRVDLSAPDGDTNLFEMTFSIDGTIESSHFIPHSGIGSAVNAQAKLQRVGPSAFPQPQRVPDKLMLSQLKSAIPSYWPPKRKSDAVLLRDAIAAL